MYFGLKSFAAAASAVPAGIASEAAVSEDAVLLVALRGQEEVGHQALALTPGDVNEIRMEVQ